MKEWRLHIENLIHNHLPGTYSHRKMLPPERDLHIPAGSNHRVLPSGVLLLVFPEGEELNVCLIKRSATMKIHAGQIGFPGGKQEPGDAGPREAALRETTEEIGLPAENIVILGSLTPLYVSVSNFMIYPFAGWIDKKPEYTLNHREVERLMFFPLLQHIPHPVMEERIMETSSGKLCVPGFPFQGEYIWGATAMILTEFLDILAAGHPIPE
jgi:8-oxo-dGTP pyrophosphatase MutT (NUDIX family)